MTTDSNRMSMRNIGARHTPLAPLVASALSLYQTHGTRLFRFGIVGVTGIVINTGVLYVLVQMFGASHLAGAAAGSEVSILGNFVLNDQWTFNDVQPSGAWYERLFRYNAVALGGMIISLGVLAMLTTLFSLHYLIANLIAIGAATLSNYALNTRFTWGGSEPTPELVPVPVYAD